MNHIENQKIALNHQARNHKLWSNPLLKAIESNSLSLEDYRIMFSQYYYYSKNFTRLLAVGMYKCESDFYRSKLSENLWEEGGGLEIEQRHSQIFRNFLNDSLGIKVDEIKFENYSINFFKDYLSLCSQCEMVECSAILSFATEGIVAQLYTLIRAGLSNVGLTKKDLYFFDLHIECDDDHSLTLQEISHSLAEELNWFSRSENAIKLALDLRDDFFSKIYFDIKSRKINTILDSISCMKETNISANEADRLHYKMNNVKNGLYSNLDLNKNINFTVDRVPFAASVLDPRIVHIPAGFNNELHRHAHETVFYFVAGNAEVILDENIVLVSAGDLVYVPRWSIHQTRNIGTTEVVILAITDFGLTSSTRTGNLEDYRAK